MGVFCGLAEDLQVSEQEGVVLSKATGRKGKGLFMPLRKALTGQAHGPEMADLMPLLHKVRAKG